MKARWTILAAVGIAGLFFVAGLKSASTNKDLSKQTKENLSTAMHGEAFAYAKYLLYAHKAQQTGNRELANLLRTTARTERFEHFAEEAELAGLVEDNATNLESAIQGESYEVDTMYREFAEQARAAGDLSAADRFEEIRKDEMKHRDAFQAALVKVEGKKAEVKAKTGQ